MNASPVDTDANIPGSTNAEPPARLKITALWSIVVLSTIYRIALNRNKNKQNQKMALTFLSFSKHFSYLTCLTLILCSLSTSI